MKKINLIFLVLVLFILSSCSDQTEESLTPIPDTIIIGEHEFELFENSLILNGVDLQEGLSGFWNVIESTGFYSLSDSLNPKCIFTGELLGQYKLKWTITNGEDNKSEEISIRIIGFTDLRDNVKYKAVKIGTQIWMAENLKATNYQNGDLINDGSLVGDYSSESEPKYWFAYNDDLSNIETYGRLYTWYAATDSREICPEGWHIPSDLEWKTLQVFLGMNLSDIDIICDDNNTVGSKLKQIGTLNWSYPNTGATDEYGFTALPAGYRKRFNKVFEYKYEYACFWSNTENDLNNAWYRHLYNDKASICRTYNLKNYGFSVRCIKN
ncbi:MAG: hypothetical protein A2X13_09585 [Bacteroidetes bacterium GWC2_33_15]|nr:MAG: hypothetical protein A2X10_10790 [Bacteroidetes bacterium GWA2_33_15]OFX48953.1 MAG: hypothetical protein A2X13_09585 [Bacteroidetes bacterium GWC2_33_15]OFX64783.1 MAG: hypothetical protein A2X15_05630 [Bacteroidetes bacterium GWB2_32_14]OFX68485.1 MAG: hypothetical protein A2X14_15185 [Bacteroidetes bacterium GWD2_33_33]HAN19211.1 hypothetical protein [Bacteroidales bacterium]